MSLAKPDSHHSGCSSAGGHDQRDQHQLFEKANMTQNLGSFLVSSLKPRELANLCLDPPVGGFSK